MRPLICFPLLLLILTAFGCATNRTITITARPADARIEIDHIDRGEGPVTETFSFSNDTDVHEIGAKRLGYQDYFHNIARDYTASEFPIEMQHQRRKINVTVFPVPAYLDLDGIPLSTEAVSSISSEVQFTVDGKNDWQTRTVTANRFGYKPAIVPISWIDGKNDYTINLEHLTKDISVTINPPGAEVYLDSQLIGKTSAGQPLKYPAVPFFTDENNQWKSRKLTARKDGYDPVGKDISWDNAQTDYTLDLTAKSKSVRIVTDPPFAVITLDGVKYPSDGSGATVIQNLSFPPDEKGVLKVYTGVASKKTADSEYEPFKFSIAYDSGKPEYDLQLKEILIRPVPLLEAAWERGDEGWVVSPRERMTTGMKGVNEGPGVRQPTLLTHEEKGVTIDSLDISPDGTQLLYTVLNAGKDRNSFHSRMMMVRTDGAGGVESVSDGRSLDLTPSFSPDGGQIAFASDRFGKRLSICTMDSKGAPGTRQLTAGDNNALWPSIDSEQQPRLFYQAMVDSFAIPRLWESEIGRTILSDLTQAGGVEPRISPRDDMLLFVGANEKTGKREIYRVSDKGGVPENLTNTPDDDEYDPAWSKDGSKIAFVEERGGDAAGSADVGNPDIWIMDLKNPGKPMQVTMNASIDDHPVWDPSGNYIYFRSNRSGSWGIWKIATPK